jgi:hypothetical protein
MRLSRKRSKRLSLVVLATSALVVVIGNAAMASNTVPASLAGYGEAAISGATTTEVRYGLSDDGKTIQAVTLTFAENLVGETVGVSFNGAVLSPCIVSTNSTGPSTATCAGLTQPNSMATSLSVAVHQ